MDGRQLPNITYLISLMNTTFGITYAIITDISKDGAMQGSSTKIYKKIIEKFPGLNLIASGGVTSEEDLNKLKNIGCYGAIVGKALYEKKNRFKKND